MDNWGEKNILIELITTFIAGFWAHLVPLPGDSSRDLLIPLFGGHQHLAIEFGSRKLTIPKKGHGLNHMVLLVLGDKKTFSDCTVMMLWDEGNFTSIGFPPPIFFGEVTLFYGSRWTFCCVET